MMAIQSKRKIAKTETDNMIITINLKIPGINSKLVYTVSHLPGAIRNYSPFLFYSNSLSSLSVRPGSGLFILLSPLLSLRNSIFFILFCVFIRTHI